MQAGVRFFSSPPQHVNQLCMLGEKGGPNKSLVKYWLGLALMTTLYLGKGALSWLRAVGCMENHYVFLKDVGMTSESLVFLWKTWQRHWEDVVFSWKMLNLIEKYKYFQFLLRNQRLSKKHNVFPTHFQRLAEKHNVFATHVQRLSEKHNVFF